MFQPATLAFLTGLAANNNKPWFDANRTAYDTARADFLNLVTDTIAGLGQVDPVIAEANLAAKSCVFRINRDVRFSKDKSPYKSNFSAWFNTGGKQSAAAGYYLHLQPGGSFVAGGMYMPEPATLAKLRQEIDYDLPGFERMLNQPAFTTYFAGLSRESVLSRPPKGYNADNPAIEYLKLKSFTASHAIPDKHLTQKKLVDEVIGAFAGLQPLVAFLNRALEP
jgi:uncharacterized protein (TIGR02453 family)